MCVFLMFIGCEKKTNTSIDKKYSITYFNRGVFASLLVFDNNDTIYYSNTASPNYNSYKKIKADKKSLEIIKKSISVNMQPNSLLIKRVHTTDSGQLKLQIICRNNEITTFRHEIDENLNVSSDFSNLLYFLNRNYFDVYNTFKPN